jgi:hypothetical protein
MLFHEPTNTNQTTRLQLTNYLIELQLQKPSKKHKTYINLLNNNEEKNILV